MKIEHFIAQSEGTWRSMRSGHSLAFQQFDNIISNIKIELLSTKDNEITSLLDYYSNLNSKPISPFRISWEADSDWGEQASETDLASGSSIFIPVPKSNSTGLMIRSLGYAERQKVICNYTLLPNDSLELITEYENSIAEEQIWFASKNVRCRSSIIRISGSSGILQTSFASEIRRMKGSAN